MSDIAPAESAPVSTADVATEVYESFESSESESANESGPVDTPSAAVDTPVDTKAPGVVQPAPKPLSEAEKLLDEAGFKAERREDGRENRIPYSKVKKIIENGINQGKGEFGQKYQALETEVTGYRTRYQELEPVLSTLEQGPEAFLAEAAKHDKRYAAYLEQRSAPAAPAPPQMADLPGPDLALPDGSRTYSLEGIQKSLIPYIVQQATAQAKAEAAAALKPITEREAKAQQQAKQAEATTALREQARASMKEAESWRHFGPLAPDGTYNEVQAAVLEELRKDSAEARAAGRRPRLSLEAAYLRVTKNLDLESESKMRERFAKEVSAAAKSPSVPRAGGETPRTGRSATTSEIAARTLARLEGGA